MLFISPYEDDYVFDFVQIKDFQQDDNHLVQMNVYHTGEYTIAVSQKDTRCLPLSSKYKYSPVKLYVMQEVVKEKQKGLVFINDSETTWKRDTYL